MSHIRYESFLKIEIKLSNQVYYSEFFWNIFTINNKFQDAVQKVSSVFLDSPIHHTSKPYLVKTHNYKKFVLCSMFYHINEKSALLMSIFRERFCNKELIKKRIQSILQMRRFGISFGNDDRLDRRHTTFYFQWFAFQNPVLHTSYYYTTGFRTFVQCIT